MEHKFRKFKIGFIEYNSEKIIKPDEIENKKPDGVSYNNCVFGQPFLVQQPPITNNKKHTASLDELVKVVEEATGFNNEMIERVLTVASNYIEKL